MAKFMSMDYKPDDIIVVDHGLPVFGNQITEETREWMKDASFVVYSPEDPEYWDYFFDVEERPENEWLADSRIGDRFDGSWLNDEASAATFI